MEETGKKSILILAGNTEALKDVDNAFKDSDIEVYFSRACYDAVKILFTKQVDAVFAFKGFSHVIDAIRLFSTIPCSCVICGNCIEPGGTDFTIYEKDFQIDNLPEYFNQMMRLSDMRAKFIGIVWFNRLKIDIDNYTVEYIDKAFKLKPLEIRLLFYLCKNLNRVISRKRLLSAVWGYEQAGATRTLDVHIMSLRALLGDNAIPLEIKTFRGEGYKLFDTETMGGLKYFN